MTSPIERLMAELPDGLDAALIASPVNRRYYTGFPSSAGWLFVTREQAALVVDFRYYEAAARQLKSVEVLLQEKAGEQLARLAQRAGVRRVGIESEAMTVAELLRCRGWFEGAELPMDNALSALISSHRRIKSPREYEAMQRAQDLADHCFTQILDFIRPGVAERSVALELACLIRRAGAEDESFDIIAVSGPNTSLPHGAPTGRAVGKGDFFTLDFGVRLDGYCSDMTRTVAVGAESDAQRAVYRTVLAAQQAALDAIRPGVPCREVDAAGRQIIGDAGYGACFGHSLGHSLGLEIHESPAFSLTETALCEPGLVMSVEPGIYLDGRFGCRIEDVVLITKDGFLNLTHSAKELLVL